MDVAAGLLVQSEKRLQAQSAPVNVSSSFQDSPDSDDESKLAFPVILCTVRQCARSPNAPIEREPRAEPADVPSCRSR